MTCTNWDIDRDPKPDQAVPAVQHALQADRVEQRRFVTVNESDSDGVAEAPMSGLAQGMNVLPLALSSLGCSESILETGGQTSFLRYQNLHSNASHNVVVSADNGSRIAIGDFYMDKIYIYVPDHTGSFSLHQGLICPPPDPHYINNLVFSLEGSMLIGWSDASIIIWCVDAQGDFQQTQQIRIDHGHITRVVISPNCQMIAIADLTADETSIWKKDQRGIFSKSSVIYRIEAVCFSPDCLGLLATARAQLFFYHLTESGSYVSADPIGDSQWNSKRFPLGFLPQEGRRLFAYEVDKLRISIWNQPEKDSYFCVSQRLCFLGLDMYTEMAVRAVCVSADGGKFGVLLNDESLQIWETSVDGYFRLTMKIENAFGKFFQMLSYSSELDMNMFFSSDGRSVTKVTGLLVVTKGW